MDREDKHVVAKEWGGHWMDWEFGVSRCTWSGQAMSPAV